MNSFIEQQLNHRTIRFFKDKPVEEEKFNQLMAVMNQTPTSSGLQTASVIRVKDQAKKQAIARIGTQPYIADAPELLIFIVDSRRLGKIAVEKGYQGENHRNVDHFLQGLTDGILMAQNLNNAVESLGLGAFFIGSVLNQTRELIDLLELPELTMPIVGLGFGYPNDNPQLKPRMDLSFKVHDDTYQEPESYVEALKTYDVAMTHYYDTREKNKRSDTYTDQVRRKVAADNSSRTIYFKVAQEQGFNLGLD